VSRIMRAEAAKLQGEFVELGQSPGHEIRVIVGGEH